MREATAGERVVASNKQTPMLTAIVPFSDETERGVRYSYMVLEQWDEHRGGWFPVPITWE